MDSKKNLPGGMTQQNIQPHGFYNDGMKSLQGVPCGSGDVQRYPCKSLERSYEMRPLWKDHWDRPRHKVSSQEMLQGGYTYVMGRDKPEDMG